MLLREILTANRQPGVVNLRLLNYIKRKGLIMWDKTNKEPMDEEMKAKWTKKIAELGVPEDKIDEHLIWVFKMVSHKLGKLRLMLDDIGVEESKAKEIIETVVARANEKDLAKIREWRDQHQENKT
jgi:hypothetical protein